MKNSLTKRVTSLFLALLMVFGVMSTGLIVTAKEFASYGKDELIYVSIGDSMTNGYGLEGYDGESGIMNYGNNVYANQFAAWLAGYDEAIKDNQVIFKGVNGTVDHRQLAMSGMRAEDLHWILDFDHTNAALAKRAMASRGTNTYGCKVFQKGKTV